MPTLSRALFRLTVPLPPSVFPSETPSCPDRPPSRRAATQLPESSAHAPQAAAGVRWSRARASFSAFSRQRYFARYATPCLCGTGYASCCLRANACPCIVRAAAQVVEGGVSIYPPALSRPAAPFSARKVCLRCQNAANTTARRVSTMAAVGGVQQ